MTALLLKLVNMSVSAGWLILAVLLFRLAFKKAPKWIAVLLWGIAAVRLVCPVSIESALSLLPSAETLPKEILSGPTFTVDTGIPAVDAGVNGYLDAHYFEGMTVPFDYGRTVMTILTVIWLVGVVLLLAYTAFGYCRLRRKVNTAVLFRDNIYQSEYVESPFLLGIIKPRIYLPFDMGEEEQAYVLAHEMAHIRRGDHWWKPLGFLLLAVYWFNPLMWLAYALLCRDIELACDERVIRRLEREQRADYSETLLTCGTDRRNIAVCPLAFGEISVKARVRSVMKYQKPAVWMVCLSLLFSTATAACFLTDPQTEVIAPNVPVIPDATRRHIFECGGVLGCKSRVVETYSKQTERFRVNQTFYVVTDAQEWPMLELVSYGSYLRVNRDLDGDRIGEIIFQSCDAEGNPTVSIYMRKGDTIYRGVFDTGKLPNFYDYGPSAVWSEFDTGKSLFRIHYAQKGCGEFAVLETRDLSLFRFEVYRVMPEEVFAYITQKTE